jgi:hypothetical protein
VQLASGVAVQDNATAQLCLESVGALWVNAHHDEQPGKYPLIRLFTIRFILSSYVSAGVAKEQSVTQKTEPESMGPYNTNYTEEPRIVQIDC